MRAQEFLTEGRAHPVIVVDVQPEYCEPGINDGSEHPICVDIIRFVTKQTGPVLMFVNAEDQGQTADTVADVKLYWEDTMRELANDYENEQPIDWSRFQIVDKGYGYFRSWMDQGVSPAAIIRVIRAMYLNRISDSREFEDIDPELLPRLVGSEWDAWMYHDAITTNWTSIAQLKRFSGAYIVGGGRNECLREVELLMNVFNIRYKRIDSLVY
jgi:hypothetical protein